MSADIKGDSLYGRGTEPTSSVGYWAAKTGYVDNIGATFKPRPPIGAITYDEGSHKSPLPPLLDLRASTLSLSRQQYRNGREYPTDNVFANADSQNAAERLLSRITVLRDAMTQGISVRDLLIGARDRNFDLRVSNTVPAEATFYTSFTENNVANNVAAEKRIDPRATVRIVSGIKYTRGVPTRHTFMVIEQEFDQESISTEKIGNWIILYGVSDDPNEIRLFGKPLTIPFAITQRGKPDQKEYLDASPAQLFKLGAALRNAAETSIEGVQSGQTVGELVAAVLNKPAAKRSPFSYLSPAQAHLPRRA